MRFMWRISPVFADLSNVKHDKPKGPFEHRAIKDVIIKTIFTSSKGMECLADAFQGDDFRPFVPVPLATIALAATTV